MIIKVEITKNIIQRGVKNSVCKCPIALALVNALQKAGLNTSRIHVLYDEVMIITNNIKTRIEFPQLIAEFIREFDNSSFEEQKLLEPFNWEFEYNV